MLNLFAAALCAESIIRGNRVAPYWAGGIFKHERRAFWNERAAECLPGVLAAFLWRP